jgi:AcrR family transcriptional regulator
MKRRGDAQPIESQQLDLEMIASSADPGPDLGRRNVFQDEHPGEGPSSRPLLPPPTLKAVRRDDPRRRMLDAMIHTVARRGYDRTTVSRVLAGADVPEVLFSEHFRDKQDCFLQALDELIGSAEQAALDLLARPAPWHERVRTGLRSLLEGLARDEDAARVVFVEMLAAGPCAHERHLRALGLFTSLMEEGRSHALHADCLPPQTSEAIVGGIASILHRRVLQGEAATLPSLLPDLIYFALLPYLDQDQAMSVAELRPAA